MKTLMSFSDLDMLAMSFTVGLLFLGVIYFATVEKGFFRKKQGHMCSINGQKCGSWCAIYDKCREIHP
jgi:hypothetical protein